MIERVNDYFICAKQDDEAASDRNSQESNNSASSGVKPTQVWQSPEFEEFDLCMEVTAYVQQWD